MKLMVIDGNSIVNRAYYGVRTMLKTRGGLYTNAIFGFLNILLSLTDAEQPDALCVTFDVHAPTFRHRMYSEYKAGRRPMPEELKMQMPVLKDVLDKMNIPRYEKEGYEADDLLGAISRKCEAENWDCVIVTGDKDSLQLITEHTKVKLVSSRMNVNTTRDMTKEAFEEEYGFSPIHMIDLKALMGDASDHLPGVPGIGEKTALSLIRMYHSIDHLYDHMPDIVTAPDTPAKPGVVKKLTDGEESARRTYELATIVTDVPDFEFCPSDHLRRAYSAELYDLLMQLEFTKLIEKLKLTPQTGSAAAPAERKKISVTSEPLEDAQSAAEWIERWKGADHVALLMTPDLNQGVVYCPTDGNTGTAVHLSFERYCGDWNALLRTLFSCDVKKVSHNVKDLMHRLIENGFPADGFVFDTALAAYLLDATQGSYELQRLSVAYFNEALPDAVYMSPDAFSMLGGSADAFDALERHVTAVEELYGVMRGELTQVRMDELYKEIELPLCAVLAEMEHTGCRVDAAELTAFGEELKKQIAQKENKIYEMAGHPFKIQSPKQLGEVLFKEMGIPSVKKTKTGYSTGAEVLEKLRFDYPIVEEVLAYRQYTKLKSTYVDGLLKEIAADGRIHTTFQMTTTATGRLSSTEPNLQNIPTRTELGSELRRMFVPEKGNVLVDADYSQIELRLLAHISHDEHMIEAFKSGADIHRATAARVFDVAPEDVTAQMRRDAKAVNFGIVYGISAFSLSKDIGVTVAAAKAYMEQYFARYSGVHQYMEDIVEKARSDGYVETLYHRRRALPELRSSNYTMRSFGERVALNMPIQGTAADIMKLAMVRVWQRLKREVPDARLVLQIHDELIVECPAAREEEVKRLLEEEMSGAAHLSVPLIAEAHSGATWYDAK